MGTGGIVAQESPDQRDKIVAGYPATQGSRDRQNLYRFELEATTIGSC